MEGVRANVLTLCVVGALAVHALAFGLSESTVRPQGHGPHPIGAGSAPIEVRWVSDKAPTAVAPVHEAIDTSLVQRSSPSPAARPAPSTESVPARAPVVESEASPLPVRHEAPATPDTFAEMDYVPRANLTVTPAPKAPIDVLFPTTVTQELHQVAALSLFIDESGAVRRVRIDTPGLPPALEEAARDAFMRGRFTPGEIAGSPVRSLIRVEVEFEATANRPATPSQDRSQRP